MLELKIPCESKVKMTSHKATLVTRMLPAGTAPANFISTLIGKASELVSKPDSRMSVACA